MAKGADDIRDGLGGWRIIADQNLDVGVAVFSGVDQLPPEYYHGSVETVTLKLDRRHIQRLRRHAQTTGRSQAAIVRDLIDRHLGGEKPSLHDQARDVCGSLSGKKDTSTRKLTGYGRD